MQKEAIKGYSHLDIMNVLQGTERLTERKQDLEASGGHDINRPDAVNTVKSWRYQNPDKNSKGRENSWEVQVSL